MRRRIPVLLLGVLLAAAGNHAAAEPNELGRPLVREFAPGSSRIGYMCQALTQDEAGFIYLAGSLAMRYFDGTAWQTIPLPPECAGIRKFATRGDGTIFMAGAGIVGFLRGSGPAAEFVSLAHRLPPSELGHDELSDVLAVGDTVYFADEEKILIWRNERFTLLPHRTRPGSGGARLHRVGQQVYVSGLDCAVSRIDADRLTVVADEPLLQQAGLRLIEAGANGALRVLTDDRGFYAVKDGRAQRMATESDRWLAGKSILKAQRLQDGGLVVAFTAPSGDGGIRFDRDGRYLGPLDRSLGLWTNTIRDFLIDREGGLWLGTEVGVFRLEWPSAVTQFDAVNGLGAGAVADVTRHEGVLHAATTEGVFRLLPSSDDGQIARFERVMSQPAYALVSHPRGLLVMGYTQAGLLTPTGLTALTEVPPGGGLLRPSTRNPDRVWIGSTRGLRSMRWNADRWSIEGPVPGIAGHVRGIVEIEDGSLLLAVNDREVYRVEFNVGASQGRSVSQIIALGVEAGLPAQFSRVNLVSLAGAPAAVFDGTMPPYRFRLVDRRFAVLDITALGREPSSEDTWVASDDMGLRAGGAWLMGPAGLHELASEGRPPRRLPHLVRAAAGPIARLWEEGQGAERVLWVGGANGLVRVEVERAFTTPASYPAVLTARAVREGEHIAREHKPLGFNYVALRHGFGNTVTYQTRLHGRDATWSAWSPLKEASLFNIGPGRYRFEVRARDADGALSVPAAVSFVVLRPWWLTAWAFFGYTTAGVALIGGLVRLRTRELRRRAEHLEAVIALRTRELGEQADQLARQNAELKRLHQLELDARISARLGEEKARLEVLRYQLNPHFLFNALATISGLAVRDPSAARAVARQLAEFCRLTLTRGPHEFVTVEEEFQLLQSYLEVVRAGAEERPTVAFTLDPAARETRIPAFLLLPLVENACKYGRRTRSSPLQITMAARIDDRTESLVIEVANTGTWLDDFADHGATPSTRIGLENIRQRLERLYPGAHSFRTEARDGWVRVAVCLQPARVQSAAQQRNALSQ